VKNSIKLNRKTQTFSELGELTARVIAQTYVC